jgi:transposase-like protein
MMPVHNYQDYLEAWEALKEQAPFNIIFREVRCKYCDSKDISKYGYYKNVQRWWCKSCKRKFNDNASFPRMKIPLNRLKAAVSMYYKGISLKSIRKQIEEEYNCFISNSTIYKWIHRLTKDSLADSNNHQLKVGNTWIVYESTTTVDVHKHWILDLIDTHTHFLLASKLSNNRNRNIDDIVGLIQSATERGGTMPKEIITKRTTKYQKGVELTFGIDARQVQIRATIREDSTLFFKYWRNALKERNMVMRNLKSFEVAKLNLNGWMYYYNYCRTQESLKGNTPSIIAEYKGHIKNYTWLE